MRRCFIALLTCLLLAQFTWAATLKCCAGEFQAHEQPVEQVAAPDLSIAQDLHASQDDANHATPSCHCHCHHGSAATGFDEPALVGNVARIAHGLHRDCHGESHIPEGLDRPNWQRA